MKMLFEESPQTTLQRAFENYACCRKEHLVFLFILAARGLGWNARLVMNINTIPLKTEQKDKTNVGTQSSPEHINGKKYCDIRKAPEQSATGDKQNLSKKNDHRKRKSLNDRSKPDQIPQLDGAHDDIDVTNYPKYNKKAKVVSKPKERQVSGPGEAYKEKCLSVAAAIKNAREKRKQKKMIIDNETTPKKKSSIHSSESMNYKGSSKKRHIRISEQGRIEAALRSASTSVSAIPSPYRRQLSSDSDSDVPKNCEEKTDPPKNTIHKSTKGKTKSKSTYLEKLNASQNENPCTCQNPCQYWAEVYIDAKWVTVDIVNGRIQSPSSLERYLFRPPTKGKSASKSKIGQILYAIAGNIDGTMNDVTKRYASEKYYVTTQRTRQPVENWIQQTLLPYKADRTSEQGKLDRLEHSQLEKAVAGAPIPKSLGAFKNHPYYALKKDLNKDQVIYPADAPTMGFIQGFGIYARECVQIVLSRRAWLKEGRVVKIGEKPYKVTTAKVKVDRMSGQKLADQSVDLFGNWQTENYEPPKAENGIVPRNEYGNVELFKPWMLPKGTIHVPIQGLSKVAKKLQIDCAPALVGWEYTNGFMRPLYDGYVICEEAQDFIMDAWNQEMDEQNKKAALKREKRAIDNWTKLVRGMLMYKKILNKYSKKK